MNAFDKLLLYWPFQKENKKTVDLFGIRYQLRRRRRFLTICRSNQVSFWWHFWLLLWEKIIGVNCPFGSGLSGKYLTLSMTTKTLKRLMIKQRSLSSAPGLEEWHFVIEILHGSLNDVGGGLHVRSKMGRVAKVYFDLRASDLVVIQWRLLLEVSKSTVCF